MADDVEVKLYLDKFIMAVEGATDEALGALALQIMGRTQVNISNNGQVDTGFMRASTYAITKEGTQGSPWESGQYTSQQTGAAVERRLAPPRTLEGAARAAVVVGAEYAIYQEVLQSFLYLAAQQEMPEGEAILEKVLKERLND